MNQGARHLTGVATEVATALAEPLMLLLPIEDNPGRVRAGLAADLLERCVEIGRRRGADVSVVPMTGGGAQVVSAAVARTAPALVVTPPPAESLLRRALAGATLDRVLADGKAPVLVVPGPRSPSH